MNFYLYTWREREAEQVSRNDLIITMYFPQTWSIVCTHLSILIYPAFISQCLSIYACIHTYIFVVTYALWSVRQCRVTYSIYCLLWQTHFHTALEQNSRSQLYYQRARKQLRLPVDDRLEVVPFVAAFAIMMMMMLPCFDRLLCLIESEYVGTSQSSTTNAR